MEKIRRTSSIICKILTVLTWITMILLALCILLFGAELVFQVTDVIDWSDVTFSFGCLALTFAADLFPARFAWFELTMLFSLIILLPYIGILLHLLRGIFRPMSQGLPFSSTVSRNLRKMAFSELIFGIVFNVQKILVQHLLFRSVDLPSLIVSGKITSCTLNNTIDGSFLAVFAILLLLSYVFRYGEELQRLSDETL